MSLKRINNELKRQKNFYEENNIEYFQTTNCNNNNIIILSKQNIDFLEFILPNEYPFKPFNINLIKNLSPVSNINNSINYQKWLSNIKPIKNIYHKLFMDILFKKDTNLNCFCCDSITCFSRWNPALTMQNGIDEYKKYLIYKLYSKEIMFNYLKKLFDNLFPNLSNDLKFKIFES